MVAVVMIVAIVAVAAVAGYAIHAFEGSDNRTTTTTTLTTGTTASSTSGASASTTTGSGSSAITTIPVGAISISDAMTMMLVPLAGATVCPGADAITFTSSDVSTVAFALAPANSTGATRMHPPSYAQDDVFVIGGLIDPTIHIPRGATLRVTVVNLDDDMYHDLSSRPSGLPISTR